MGLWAAEPILRDGTCAMAVLWLSGPVDYASLLRMLCLETASNRWADLLMQPQAGLSNAVPLDPAEFGGAWNRFRTAHDCPSRVQAQLQWSQCWADSMRTRWARPA